MKDAVESNIIDLYITKHWAIKFATAAACTVLRVDQVLVFLCDNIHTVQHCLVSSQLEKQEKLGNQNWSQTVERSYSKF